MTASTAMILPLEPELTADAEESVLSAMLMDRAAVAEVRAADVRAEDFADPHRALVFSALLALEARGVPIDPLTLAGELNGTLDKIGGKDFIGYLVDVVPTAANVRYHAELVVTRAKRRKLADVLEQNARALREGKAQAAEVATRLRPALEILSMGAPQSVRRIQLTGEDALLALEPPPWLIAGVLPMKCLALLFGASESFKSFIALDIALHIALGLEWHGHQIQKGGAIVYVAAEGFWGMRKRYLSWKKYHGITGNVGIYFLSHAIDVRKGSTDIRELIEALRDQVGGPVGGIFLDTLNRNFTGNENASDAMTDYLRGCDELREETGAPVVSVHHTGHLEAERGRGHSSLRAALDTEIKCSRDGDRVTVECTKLKDGPHFPALTFDMVPVADSLVPKPVGSVDHKMTPSRAAAAKVLPMEGGLTRRQWEQASELKAGTFRHARDWLITEGYARQTRDGKYVKTEAGNAAALPDCQSTAKGLPTVKGECAATRGGI